MQGLYLNKPPEWRDRLHDYLLKAEIEYLAEHGGDIIPFLQPYIDTPDAVLVYLKLIGFRVKRRFEVDGTKWIKTTTGISICLNDGFCIKNAGQAYEGRETGMQV